MSSDESKSSMLPPFLNDEYMGYPLWNWLLLILVVVAVAYWAKGKGYLHAAKQNKEKEPSYGAYYY
jgi:hypothetical protein